MTSAVAGGAGGSGSGADFVDIVEKIRDFLQEHCGCSRKELARGQLDLSGLLITHKRTEYPHEPERVQHGVKGVEEGQTLFRTELENSTNSKQTITLHTEREVTATYSITMQRCFAREGSLSLTISPPASAIKAAIGAKASLSLTSGRQASDSEKTRWSLDTPVEVQAKHKMEVVIHLIEEELSSDFSVQTRISGRVVFRPMDKAGRPLESKSPIVIDDLRNVLLPRDGFQKVEDDLAVIFTSYGNIYCKYGVNQKATFKEEPL